MKKRILIITFSLLLLTGCSNTQNHTKAEEAILGDSSSNYNSATISEVEDGWIAKFNGGCGEMTFHTYVYKVENGYRYINTTSSTVSYGSTQWTEVVTDSGTVSTKEEIVEIADDNGSAQHVEFPDDSEAYMISDFLNMD